MASSPTPSCRQNQDGRSAMSNPGEPRITEVPVVQAEAGGGDGGGLVLPNGVTVSAALLRVSLGLVYLWAFIAQGFGIDYANSITTAAGKPVSYGWHFSYDSSLGWITSGFSHSPTDAYIGNTHGPFAFIVQDL